MHLSPGKLWGLRRMADAQGRFKMTAVDQRPPIMNPVRAARGLAEAPYDDVLGVKLMLIEELQGESSAMLLDPHFALPKGMALMNPAKGLVVTLEDAQFTLTPDGRLSRQIDDWSVEKIKRCGGDAVKVLAWYRPDAAKALCRAQQDLVQKIGEDCARFDIPFLFELLVYALPGEVEADKDYVEIDSKHAGHVLESVRTFADAKFGIDIFKLESPVPAAKVAAAANAQALFDELGRLASRPWVMLSAGAGMDDFETILKHAYQAGASGYLAGRAIWAGPFAAFPDWQAMRAGLRTQSVPYMRRINALTDAQAQPWTRHPKFAEGVGLAHADASFRHHYRGFGQ